MKKSRWFRVTGERFDWFFAPGKMKSFKKGFIYFEPERCVADGEAKGLVERISRPNGMMVDKSGRVVNV